MSTGKDDGALDDVEQRIWDLMAQDLTMLQISERLAMQPAEVARATRRILRKRGTPGLEVIDRHIARLGAIRF